MLLCGRSSSLECLAVDSFSHIGHRSGAKLIAEELILSSIIKWTDEILSSLALGAFIRTFEGTKKRL